VKPHALYLHGFASSPKTAKGVALGERLTGSVASYQIPAVEGDAFRSLTMDGIFTRAEAALRALPADGAPALLIGSSLGGYSAAFLAAAGRAPRVAALLLIAPAFGFTDSWLHKLGGGGIEEWRRKGERNFFHHAQERELPLGVAFLESCERLPAMPGEPRMPVAIVHGRQDETVDCRRSVEYAQARANVDLHVVQGDHRLTEPRHEDLIAWCARDLIARFS
jgi:predicted esterase YcpF (UPF0227 family)